MRSDGLFPFRQRLTRTLAGAALLAMACNGDSTSDSGIVVALATDMTVPDSIDEVGLYIEHVKGSERTLVVSQEQRPLYNPRTGQYELRFTATFAVAASNDPQSDSIRTRFVGFGKDGTAVAMREGRVSMPDQDVRQLRLPLLFVNEGRVEDTTAGAVTPAAGGVETRQVAAGSRTDPFTRWRHPGCREDETLGDDGECTSIDLDPSTLPDLDDVEQLPCVDTLQCFGGERGVRELALGADCTVSTAGLDANAFALALRVPGGYTDLHAQFVPDNLYAYDANTSTITLKRRLCERARGLGVSRVLVSIRCAPMRKDAPICAPWQDAPPPVKADDTASFPTDPPLPDGETPDTGDGPADSSGDADASEPLQAFTRVITLPPRLNSDELLAFVARPQGKTWIIVGGDPSYGVVAPDGDGDADASQVQLSNEVYLPSLWLGTDSTAYLFQRFQGASALPDNGGTSFTRVTTGGECGLTGGTETPEYFSVGSVGGATVAVYGGSGGPARASVVDPVDRSCFRGTTPLSFEYRDVLYRGMEYAGRFQIPAVNPNSFLVFDPAPDGGTSGSVPFAPLPAPNGATVTVTSLVDVGGGGAALVAKYLVDGKYQTVFHRVTPNGNAPAPGPLVATQPDVQPTHEVFGGGDVLCARLVETGSETFRELTCIRNVTQGAPQVFGWTGSKNVDDLHVYGDASYLYLAKACFSGSQLPRLLLTATPWEQVNEDTASVLRDGVTCPNQTI